MPSESATYSHGHHSSVTSHHALRTAANSASFLLPHLTPTSAILDLGCGPGSITADFASLCPSGKVIGVDAVDSVLTQARDLCAARQLSNVSFEVGDANRLRWEDGVFDVVFCHQLLQHVRDPVGILKEMKRVCKRGGVVAVREADYSSFTWWPRNQLLERWQELYLRVARGNGGEPDAGRWVREWCVQAGWERGEVRLSWDSWVFDGEGAEGWGESWAGRTLHSGFAEGARKEGVGEEELVKISEGWREWGKEEGALLVVPNGEVLCWKK